MKLLIGSFHTSDERVSRRWLRVARGGWIVYAIGLLVHFVIGVPAYYQSLFVPCILSELGLCSMGQLTSKNFESLQHMHFTVQTYAIAVTAVATATSILFWVVGILIFWLKGQDWMGLFVSFLLIVYGSVGVNDTFLYIGKAPTALQALGLLIVILQWPALGAFLLTFPTGRFMPRWSWVIILCGLVRLASSYSASPTRLLFCSPENNCLSGAARLGSRSTAICRYMMRCNANKPSGLSSPLS